MARVLCAMSGGVDSSVAAALLVEQGHEVIGVTMKLWRGEDDPFAAHRFGGCCTLGDSNDARRVAHQLGLPYYVLNLQEEFHDAVVDNFVAEYAAGRTPNPCARCNEFIKFRAFLARADELNCDFIATGHYAQITREPAGHFVLRRGADHRKDQSYVLGMLTQKELSRTLLPIGHLDKPATRALAAQLGFAIADKPDSQEICFVEDGDYARFVTQRAPQMAEPGPIFNQAGERLGTHQGLAHYTVGQRKGLGIAAPQPLFVTKLNVAENAVTVGERDALQGDSLQAGDVKWSWIVPPVGSEVSAQTRAHSRPWPATLVAANVTGFEVRFHQPQSGISPGQLCVLYQDDAVIGAGTIE